MKIIAQVVVGLPVEGPFDYRVEGDLGDQMAIGIRVAVSFGRNKRVGYVVGLKQKSAFKNLKPIITILDQSPILNDRLLRFTKEFSEYYGCSRGEAIETSLPVRLRLARSYSLAPASSQNSLPAEQAKPILLHAFYSVKGWDFILEKIKKTLRGERSVLFLVPEIIMIPALVNRLKKDFTEPVAVLDKKLSPAREFEQWTQISSGQARIVVGTRSAVFAPLPSLGLIVIYEEENPNYKQDQTPFYHARTVAQMRSRIEGSQLLYVSGTPSVDIWWSYQKGLLSKIDPGPHPLAVMQLIDLTNYKSQMMRFISYPLRNLIEKALIEKEKVVLYFNRKGFHTVTRCPKCGFMIRCDRCDAMLTYMYSKKKLFCRLCHKMIDGPSICPQCQSPHLQSFGGGAEKLESELARIFPQARIDLFESESSAYPREADIVIATQALLRLKEELTIPLIGVVNIDPQLNRFDYRSAEKVFALLVHLRSMALKKLIVQTRLFDNYCLQSAARLDFAGFYRQELKLRKEMRLPPYVHLLALVVRGPNEERVIEVANAIFAKMQPTAPATIEIDTPQPDFIPKWRDQYRYLIMLKGASIKKVMQFTKKTLKGIQRKSGMIITINVDP